MDLTSSLNSSNVSTNGLSPFAVAADCPPQTPQGPTQIRLEPSGHAQPANLATPHSTLGGMRLSSAIQIDLPLRLHVP